MPNLDYIDGFEHQTLSTAQFGGSGTGIWDTISNPSGISFVAGRTGVAIQLAEDGVTSTEVSRTVPSTQTRVFSGYFKLNAAPAGTSNIWALRDSGSTLMFRLRANTNGTVSMISSDGTAQNNGLNVCDGQWHLLDAYANTASTTWTIQWRIDTIAQTDVTASSVVATNSARIRYGSGSNGDNATPLWDDCVASATAGDFPIGPHKVLALVPTGDGSHVPSTIIQNQSGTVIGAVTAFDLLDEWPANTTDYVLQTTDSTTNYAEVTFDDTSETIVWGVSGLAALFSAGTSSNHGVTRAYDASGTLLGTVYFGDMSETSLHYKHTIIPGSWTPTLLNGTKVRIGMSNDANPDPYWSAIQLQYAVPEAQSVFPGLLNQSGVLFAPKANRSISVSIIRTFGSGGFTMYAPRVRKGVNVPLLDQTGVLFGPQLNQKVGGDPAFQADTFQADTFQIGPSFFIDRSPTLFAPKINQQVDPPAPTGGASAFQTDAFQMDTFQAGGGDGLDYGTLFGPNIVTADVAQEITAPLIDRSGVLFAPAVRTTDVAGELIDQSGVLFAPQPNLQVQMEDIGLYDSPEVFWDDPEVHWDGGGAGGLIDQSPTLFAPSVTYAVFPDLLTHTAMFAPSVNPGYVSAPLINRSGVLYGPSVDQTVEPEFIDQSGVLFEFTFGEVAVDLIDQSGVLFAPSINPQYLDPTPLINQSGVPYAPEVSSTQSFPLIDQSGVLYEPYINIKVVFTPLINQSGVLFQPNAAPVIPPLLNQSGVVFTPLVQEVIDQLVRLDDDPAYFIDQSGVTFDPEVQLAPPRTITGLGLIDQTGVLFVPRVFQPTRPIIIKHARYDPVITKRARHSPVIVKRAVNARQG